MQCNFILAWCISSWSHLHHTSCIFTCYSFHICTFFLHKCDILNVVSVQLYLSFLYFLMMKARLKSYVTPVTGTPFCLYQCLATILKIKNKDPFLSNIKTLTTLILYCRKKKIKYLLWNLALISQPDITPGQLTGLYILICSNPWLCTE